MRVSSPSLTAVCRRAEQKINMPPISPPTVLQPTPPPSEPSPPPPIHAPAKPAPSFPPVVAGRRDEEDAKLSDSKLNEPDDVEASHTLIAACQRGDLRTMHLMIRRYNANPNTQVMPEVELLLCFVVECGWSVPG